MRPPWSNGWELLGRLGDRGGAVRRRTGPELADRRTGGGSGPTTSIRNAGGAFTNRMTAETLGVRADIACVIYICTWAVTTIPKCCCLFLDQLSRFMPLNLEFKRRNKRASNSRCCIQALDSTTCVAASLRHPDLTACSSGTQDRKTISILATA